MPLMKPRQPEPEPLDPFDPPLVRALADHPVFAREVARENAFRELHDHICKALERLALEGHFANRPPSGASDGERDAVLRARLVKLQALPAYRSTDSTEPAPADVPPALAAALGLLKGEDVPPEVSPAERRARLERERQTLKEAMQLQAGIVEQLRAELSYEVCKELKAHHDAVLVAFLRALQTSAALADKERDFRSALLIAGYEIQPDLLPAPFIAAPVLLGSERRYDSQISNYRRFLQQRGIVS
jgi:hypothetical protein